MYFRSPGRINLIGEHTDYNGGYVLPAAVNRYTYVGIDYADEFEAYSHHFKARFKFSLDNKHEDVAWLNYVKGALFSLRERVKILKPVKIEILGDLPLGAGLSSSASLMVGIVYAVGHLQKLNLSRQEVAEIAHRAENDFVGVSCGIMDQYAVSLAKKNSFLFLDAKRGEYAYVDADGFPKIIVIDSGVKHELSGSEYNARKSECKKAEKLIGASLRNVTLESLENLKTSMPSKLYNRALHVIMENERVEEAVKAIKKKDWWKLGTLLYASHESLRDLYEVSTEEIDYIVGELEKLDAVYGARIMGGGFGGSVLALFKGDLTKHLRELKLSYEKRFKREMRFLHVKIGAGVRKLSKIKIPQS